ncbi:hypothetical protein FRX31_026988 [Thalictrum thalictroides]|uniref:Uncharacterized protein n=1 Tax=Thalictrum thalictroides TaxID=46969 RepID=A0A7J6VGL2_THATH|nr:hypothetical protein FRX31_026988 [Thalictrum thalictroides]
MNVASEWILQLGCSLANSELSISYNCLYTLLQAGNKIKTTTNASSGIGEKRGRGKPRKLPVRRKKGWNKASRGMGVLPQPSGEFLGQKKWNYYLPQEEIHDSGPLGSQSSTPASTPISTQASQTNQAIKTRKRKTPETTSSSTPAENVLRRSPRKGKNVSMPTQASKPPLSTQKNPKQLGVRTRSFMKCEIVLN